jgi:hypothetical protein
MIVECDLLCLAATKLIRVASRRNIRVMWSRLRSWSGGVRATVLAETDQATPLTHVARPHRRCTRQRDYSSTFLFNSCLGQAEIQNSKKSHGHHPACVLPTRDRLCFHEKEHEKGSRSVCCSMSCCHWYNHFQNAPPCVLRSSSHNGRPVCYEWHGVEET